MEERAMRRARLKVAWEGFYHVVSRINGRRFLLDDEEKRILLGTVRAAAEFSGVEVNVYALMDNHFHLLVRVPPKGEVADAELARRIRALYGPERSAKLFALWEKWESKGHGERVAAAKKRLLSRMNDLSQFCKTFKETYTQGYNERTGNTGTIWEGRFKSVLLEGDYRTLMTVAGYIHLNPVRAGMVEEASAAANTSYGAACAGDAMARRGLVSLLAHVTGNSATDWIAARTACEEAVEGALARDDAAMPEARIPVKEDESGGNEVATVQKTPTVPDLLRKRCAGFLQGGALGGAAFMARLAELVPPRKRRRSGSVLESCKELGVAPAFGVRDFLRQRKVG